MSYGGTSAPFPIQIAASVSASYPWLGAIQGFANTDANLGVGSSNCAVLGAATLTALGATPAPQDNRFTENLHISTTTEASIRSQPGTASPLSIHWVNTNNSLPATSTLLVDDVLVLPGDPAAFTNQYVPAIRA